MYFMYLFLETGREGEIKREKNQFVVAFCMPPTGDLAWNPGLCPDWDLTAYGLVRRAALSPQRHTIQGPTKYSYPYVNILASKMFP